MPLDEPSPIHFPWEILDAIIGGSSAIDVPALHLHNLREAEDFLECYGYDWFVPAQRVEVEEILRESLLFLEEELLFDEEVVVPSEVRRATDARLLLLWASGSRSKLLQRWSCALLRIAHTFAHCRSHFNEWYGDEIRAQIFSRFRAHLQTSGNGMSLGRGPFAIPLERFEVKHGKPIRSIVMKLLHKAENVATDIFDHVGLRFVTEERYDALLVVKYLRANNVTMFANVKPSRSQNTLIDIEWLRAEAAHLDEEVRSGRMSRHQQLAAIRKAVRNQPYPAPPARSLNPHSSLAYHSLQFTCRQKIRIVAAPRPQGGPVFGPLKLGASGEELTFFFPFEVQVMDKKSYERSRSGLASHRDYKTRQRRTVKRRVLGTLIPNLPADEFDDG